MGGKESKPLSLTYEEAAKRVSEGELSRLKDAYKRTATLNGIITRQAFIKDVLGDGVPSQLAELVYQACGGTARGITFKDLLCSLVLLTRGTQEERIRFIFSVYANEAGSHVVRSDMLRQLQNTEGGFPPEILHKCFNSNERVGYDEFRGWLLKYPDATTVTKWLLAQNSHVTISNDLETPTFYQTLAGVTHLEETDILELEKRYWALKGSSPTGKLDSDTLVPLIAPPLPLALARGVFNAFDENRDNHIDFKEMACGISAACRGPQTERQKFCFKIFDCDRDGKLNKEELTAMVQALLLLKDEETEDEQDEVCVGVSRERVDELISELLENHDPNNTGHITQEEYLMWTLNNSLSTSLMDIIFQVCHIVLGLKTSTPSEEGEIVHGWLRRAEKKSLTIGQFWYIINMEWWNIWIDYIYLTQQTSALSDCSSLSPSSHTSSPANSQPGSLKRTKLHKKSAESYGTVASDQNSGVLVTSITSMSAADSLSLTSLESEGSLRADASRHGSLQRNHRQNPSSSSSSHNSSSISSSSSPASQCSPRKNYSSGNLTVYDTSSPSQSPRLTRRATTLSTTTTTASPGGMSLTPSRPPAIDNYPLVEPTKAKVMLLTGEGGRLKRNIPLVQDRDFVLVPDSLWKALQQWYGGSPALPRQVIHGRCSGEVDLELYPVTLRLLRHVTAQQGRPPNNWVGIVGGYGTAALNSAPYYVSGIGNNSTSSPKRYLAYMAAFSRLATMKQVYDYLALKLRLRIEDVRLWYCREEGSNMILLDEDDQTVEAVGLIDMAQVLIEVRNKDLTWPEEMSQIAATKNTRTQSRQGMNEAGVTGLNNLGNTCFLNAALQCCSNTLPLKEYFMRSMHLFELNPSNPNGMKGHMARQYGNLMQEIWSGGSKTVAPLKLRWTIGKYSGNFTGFQQHDSQELLAFLLDGLHEDLNRVHNKPYVELKDSEGRPDILVAQEAWENHILRNKSVIVDLFHGQLKSKVTCKICGNESVRFDPFTYLTLQLPMESYVYIEIIIIRLDGGTPVKYGLRLNSDCKYFDVKNQLHLLTSIPPHQIMLCELANAQIKTIPLDEARIRGMSGSALFGYELPSPLSVTNIESGRPGTRSSKDRHPFTQIQRSTHSSVSVKDSLSNSSNSEGQRASSASSTHLGSASHSSQPNSTHENGTSTHQRKDSDSSSSSNSSGPSTGSLPWSAGSPPSGSSSAASIQHHQELCNTQKGFITAFHRKMMRQEVYFLSSQKTRPSLFGLPLIVPCNSQITHQDLYQSVWTQVSRLVSPLPPSESAVPNHAQDCDDSLGYEFPFVLCVVDRDGLLCASCPWWNFCRGCQLPCNDNIFHQTAAAFIAIDWDPTALHLRYQTALERVFNEHSSVELMRRKHVEPIALSDCLEAFCSEETLEYSCEKCKKLQQAAKKLQIWRLPPILIVHLKRFQFVGNKWIKSQKIVDFPLREFDPTEYLASVPRQTIHLHRAELEGVDPATYISQLGDKDNIFLEILPENKVLEHIKGDDPHIMNGHVGRMNGSTNGSIPNTPSNSAEGSIGTPSESISHTPTPLRGKARRVRNGSVLYGETLQDFHQHRLEDSIDPLDLKYNLYAIACHSGIMEGGHYVCYAKNPQGKWICFNDSSCKEVPESQIDLNSAYMLFYMRNGLSVDKYLPNVEGKTPFPKEMDEESEAEYKKQCSVM